MESVSLKGLSTVLCMVKIWVFDWHLLILRQNISKAFAFGILLTWKKPASFLQCNTTMPKWKHVPNVLQWFLVMYTLCCLQWSQPAPFGIATLIRCAPASGLGQHDSVRLSTTALVIKSDFPLVQESYHLSPLNCSNLVGKMSPAEVVTKLNLRLDKDEIFGYSYQTTLRFRLETVQ